MTAYKRIAALTPQPSDNDNRIICVWTGPDGIERTYAVNQRTLKRYTTADALKAALDDWTQKSFGYTLNDIWFHLNRDGTWAAATGATPPAVWPEDEVTP